MTPTVIFSQKYNGQQLDMDGNLVEPTPTRRKAAKPGYVLTQRDLKLLNAILDFGGVLTTVQISVLLWPPDVKRRLSRWGMPNHQVAECMDTYPAAYLAAKVDLLKWGIRVNRVVAVSQRSKAELRLIEWIAMLEPLLQDELRVWLEQMASTEESEWLSRAIFENGEAPHAFTLRPRLPSDSVSSACKSRLRYLAKNDLIEKQEQPTRLSEGRAQSCWYLTRAGRNAIADARKVKPPSLDWKRIGAYGTLHLGHRLAINDFRIAILLACRQKGYRIRRWLDDNQLKRLLAKEKVQLLPRERNAKAGEEDSAKHKHALKIPDGFFWLDMGAKGERHCFFELDNQTLTLNYANENPKDFAQKIHTLSAFYRSGRYKEIFPEAGESMWHLTVTTGSQERLVNLCQTSVQAIGEQNRAQDRYWFAQMEHIPTWQDVFSDRVFNPIWLRAGSDRWWSLDEER